MPSSTWDSDPAWQLYLDWCHATGRDSRESTEADLERFFDEVPVADATRRARQRTIRRRLGFGLPPQQRLEAMPGPAWRAGDDPGELAALLAGIPTAGWTSGLRGRRDAFLLVAVHHGLTRREAARLTSEKVSFDGVPVLAGHAVGAADDSRCCPGCAVVRWLNALGLNRSWGRGVLRAALVRQKTAETGHVCDSEPQHHEWVYVPTLVPGIDKHGWIDEHRRLSRRTVSTILARRHAEPRTGPPSEVTGLSRGGDLDAHGPRDCDPSSETADLDRMTRLLDEMEERAAAHHELVRRLEAEAQTLRERASRV